MVEYTPAQVRGATDTSDAGVEEPAGIDVDFDQPSIEEAAYPSIEAPIPGMGQGTEECGTVVPQEFCDGEEAHVHFGRHLCGRRQCPRCWNSQWAGPRTTSVVQRLAAARWSQPDGLARRIVHAQISPPDGEITSVERMFEERSTAIQVAKDHGVRGGIMIVHPYRPTKAAKEAFWDAETDGGIWRFIRENDTHWYSQVVFRPHYHVVGLCADFEEADGDGWVIQNLSTGKGVEPNPSVDRTFAPLRNLHDDEPYDDMISVVRYLLSHTADVEGRQSVTWYGALHGTNFDPEEELSDGALATISRKCEELVGHADDNGQEANEEASECPEEGCDGHLHDIWAVPDYIDQRGDDLAVEALVRLRTAFDWRVRDEEEMPMGGWPTPTSEEAAQEALGELL